MTNGDTPFEASFEDRLTNEDPIEASTSQTTSTSTRTRGVALLDGVKKAVDLSVDFDPVTFLPVGVPGTKYTNWVGLEARSKISILEEHWQKINEANKEHLWSAIKKHWNIPNDNNTLRIKTMTMKIANTSWKNFKKHLIRKYLQKGNSPCSKYTFISNDTWIKFCGLKSTPEFKEKSAKGRALVQKNTNPHRLGSKGYLGKKAQWEKEKEQGKSPEIFSISSERARNFLLARRVKVGPEDYNLPENIQQLADKIIDKETQATQGVWVPKAGQDPLMEVLGIEHSGRTRGVSHIVGLRTSLPGLADKKRNRQDVDELARKVEAQQREFEASKAQLEARQKQLEEQIQMLLSQNLQPVGSPGMRHSSIGSATCLDWIISLEHPTPCELIQGSTRLACATGLVHPIGNGLLHTTPIKPGYVKVQVDMIFDGFDDVELPVPNEYMEKLKDAIRSFIQWPQNDVVLRKTFKSKPAKPLHMVEERPSRMSPTSALILPQVRKEDETHSKKSVALSQQKKQKVTQKKKGKSQLPDKMQMRPIELQNFFIRLNSNEEWLRSGLTIEAEEGVFGVESQLIAMSYDDLYDLMTRGWLESGIIAAFMRGLHVILNQKARKNNCAFLHPDTISASQIGMDSSGVMDVIFNAFMYYREKEFFIAPYIQRDHWLLVLVRPRCRTTYIFDSMQSAGKTPESYDIKNIIDSAITKYNMSVGSSQVNVSAPVTWNMVKCNQQKRGWECGYYVCKWLFHFVMEHQYIFPNQNPWTTEPFTDGQLDEIAIVIVKRLTIDYFQS